MLNLAINDRSSLAYMFHNKTYFDPNYDVSKRLYRIPPNKQIALEASAKRQEKKIELNMFSIEKQLLKAELADLRKKIIPLTKEIRFFKNQLPTERKTIETKGKRLVDSLETFIEFANYKFYERYDYSKFVWVRKDVNGIIICPDHGEFQQTPHNHLNIIRASHCPKCAVINRQTGRVIPWRMTTDLRDVTITKTEKQKQPKQMFQLRDTVRILETEKNELWKKIRELDTAKRKLHNTKMEKLFPNVVRKVKKYKSKTLKQEKGVGTVRALTYENVVEILSNPSTSTNQFARTFKVSPRTIYTIRKKIAYKEYIKKFEQGKIFQK